MSVHREFRPTESRSLLLCRGRITPENIDANQLVLVDIASGVQRVLTANRPEVSRPRWSPSGTELAFLAKNRASGDRQIQVFVLPMGVESRG